MSLAGAVIDSLTGTGLGLVFGILFVAACVVATVAVDHHDLRAVAFMPPLVFLAAALLAGAFSHGTGSWLSQERNETGIALLLAAPALFVAEVLTLVVVALRVLRLRGIESRRRSRARSAVRPRQ